MTCNVEIARMLSKEVLCLPFYETIEERTIRKIAEIIRGAIGDGE